MIRRVITAGVLLCTAYALPALAADAVTHTTTTTNTTDNGWSNENQYWSKNYSSRPYYSNRRSYSIYAPAYRYGVENYSRHNGSAYNSLDQQELERGWNTARGESQLNWQDAQIAAQDAYTRMYDNAGKMGTSNTTVPETSVTGVH